MRRVVIDTNIYIDWFNAGRHEEVLFQRDAVKHLSAVVLMELRAGAFTLRDRRLVQRVETAFARARRILVPSRAVFVEAGDALRRLQANRGFPPRDQPFDRQRCVNRALGALHWRDNRDAERRPLPGYSGGQAVPACGSPLGTSREELASNAASFGLGDSR